MQSILLGWMAGSRVISVVCFCFRALFVPKVRAAYFGDLWQGTKFHGYSGQT